MDIRRGSISEVFLTVLEQSVDGFVKLQDFRQHPSAYLYGDGRNLSKSALSKAIVRLKEKGFVKAEKIGIDEIVFKLTDEGKTALLLNKLEEEDWDGKWRVVIFDIPEQKRLVRDLLRRNLKKWGFKPLQKSVWISKKNVTNKLFDYICYLKIEKWVWVFESDKYGPMDIH